MAFQEGLTMRFLIVAGVAIVFVPCMAPARDSTDGHLTNETPAHSSLHDIIISHGDENRVLALFHLKEDGSSRRRITNDEYNCLMPSCSPDGKKIVYVRQSSTGMALWLTDLDGKNARALTTAGRNLVPSWLPDSTHVVWMKSQPGKDPSHDSQLHILNIETGNSRRLFTDPTQMGFSNAMPTVSPTRNEIAFVSNRSGHMRIWVSQLDGSDARLVSPPDMEDHAVIKAPIEQKVPAWSPDGKWIAHWEGVEMIHLSQFTGIPNPERDQMILETFHVWVVDRNGKNRRKVGRGDDPTWSPDGFVTRAFPDQKKGGPRIMIETATGEKELPIIPPKRNWGRFTWKPSADKTD